MAFTHVQGTGAASSSSAASQAATFSSNVTVGNLISVKASSYHGAINPTITVSDNQGNVYTSDISNTFGISQTSTIFRAIALSTGSLTVTVSSSPNGFIVFGIDEINIGSGTIAFDTSNFNSGTGSSMTAGSMTLSYTDLIVTLFYVDLTGTGGLTYTAGSGFTLGYASTAVNQQIATQYDLSATTSSNPACTNGSTTTSWSGISVAYHVVSVTTIYSNDPSFSSDSYIPLINQSDSPSEVETFIHSTLVSENSAESDYQLVLSSLFSIELVSALESFLTTTTASGQSLATLGQSFLNETALLTVYSQDAALGLESQYLASLLIYVDAASALEQFLRSIFVSDTPVSIEAYLRLALVYSTDMATELESNLISNYLYLTDSSSVTTYTLLTISSTGDPVTELESQYSTASITDAYLYNTDSAYTQIAYFLLSSLILTDSSQESEDQLITSSVYVLAQANYNDQAFEIESQLIYILHMNDTHSFDSFTTIITSFPMSDLSYDSVMASDQYFLLSTIFGREPVFGTELNYIYTSFWSTDQGYQYSRYFLSPFDVESVQGLDFSLTSLLDIDASIINESFFQSTYLYSTDFARTIERQYITSSVQTNVDAAVVIESQELAIFPVEGYAGGLETNFQATTAVDSGFYASSFIRTFNQTQISIANDQYIILQSILSASSAITDSGLAQESWISTILNSQNAISPEANIVTFIGSQSVDSASTSDTQYISNLIIVVDQGFTIA